MVGMFPSFESFLHPQLKNLTSMFSTPRSALFVALLFASQVFAIVPRAANPCESQCADYTKAASCTTSLTCQCTASTAQDLQTCVNCIVSVGGSPVVQTTQNTVDVYNDLCTGIAIPLVTVSGGSLSTTAGASTAGQNTGVSAMATPQGSTGSNPSASVTSPSQGKNAAPTGVGQKSGAISARQVMAIGPVHVLVGCVAGMLLAV